MPRKKPLIDNDLEAKNNEVTIRISSRAQTNGLKIRPFRFLESYSDQNSDQLLARAIQYKKPVLRKGTRWWIEYYFRVPADVKHLYPGTWRKFRVFEDINRYKTDMYAQLLLDSVIFGLKNGYNPFEHQKAMEAGMISEIDPKKNWTITQGLAYFLQQWAERGNERETLRAYEGAVHPLQKWLTERSLQNRPLADLQRNVVRNYLRDANDSRGWSNRTYNNNLNLLRTAFSFLVDEEMISKSPATGIHPKPSKSEKHRYYDPQKFKHIREVMEKKDPLVFFAAKLVYYLCIRSNKELRAFKVEDIFLDRRQVRVKAESAKTDTTRYIAIPDELYPELAEIWEKHNGNHYVIGAPPAGKRRQSKNKPGPAPFGKNFLGERFAEIREAAGFDDSYTLYAFKHTRIIHLKQDGGKDSDIMQLTGHTSYEAYSGYLRDLGIDGNPEAINKISRKF